MPIIIAAAAAMQYYYKNNEHIQKNIRQIDPKINLKQKSTIRLHAMEQTLTLHEPPITTITYCSIKEDTQATFLASFQQRLEGIIQANPWLCGWLLPMPDLHIVYDPTGRDRTPSYYTVHTTPRPRPRRPPPKKNKEDIEQQHQPHNDHHYKIYNDTIVLSNNELIGQNQPIFKVSIIPVIGVNDECDESNEIGSSNASNTTSTEYAIVMSMSHLVGDAHSYYQIFNMLWHADDHTSNIISENSMTIQSLNPIRVSNYVSAVQEIFGTDSNPILMYHQQQSNIKLETTVDTTVSKSTKLRQRQEEVTAKMKAKLHIFMKNVKAKRSSSSVNASQSNNIDDDTTDGNVVGTHNMSTAPEDTTPRSFDLDTSYDSHHSSTTTCSTSSIDDSASNSMDDSIGIPKVSPDVAIQQQNLMEKMNIPVQPIQPQVMKVFRISQEWIMAQRKMSLNGSCNDDINISVNSVLSAWFYRITNASTCILMMNLRNKIDDHCTIANTDVGNYAHTIIGNDTEFHHPIHVHNAVSNISTATSSTAVHENVSPTSMLKGIETPKVNKEEGELSTPKNVSICTNWINFPLIPSNNSNVSSYCEIQLHLPIIQHNMPPDIPLQQQPQHPDVSVMTLFHLHQSSSYHLNSITNYNTATTINNIGAMIICSEDVWIDHIAPSGMVVSV